MISTFPDYEDIINKLILDIESRTGLVTEFKIDNQDRIGDTPTSQLELVGSQEVKSNLNGIVLSHVVLFKLAIRATATNYTTIAEIIKGEARISEVFPIPLDYKAVRSESYELSDISDYNANYHAEWSPQTGEMRENEYERKWDLILKITKRR